MTSQQIVFNKSGVAIASDSMVSIGSAKTFPSVNKLFSMGEVHSVGLMVCNAANHIPSGTSWERIFKLYIDQQTKPKDTMAEYVESFRAFISEFERTEDTSELNKQQIVMDLVNHFTDLISPASEREELLSIGPLARYIAENQEVQGVILSVLEDRVDQLIQEEIGIFQLEEERGQLEQFKDVKIKLAENWKPLIEEATQIFCNRHGCIHIQEKIEHLFQNKLYDIVDYTWRPYSQIVIAGFGKKELLPSVWTFNVGTDLSLPDIYPDTPYGSFGPWICYKIRSSTDINDQGNWIDISEKGDLGTTYSTWGTNLPFAQNDAATTFLMGINDYSRYTLNREVPSYYLSEIYPKILATICNIPDLTENEINRITETMDKFVKPESTNELRIFVDYLTTNLRNQRQSRFDRIICHLPQQELSELAMKLVELEATAAQFVNAGLPSVGGDIDVASITKEEGFKWITKN